MRYPCAIETGNGVYGVIFPDLPGCYPSGETLEDAFKDAKEAAESWMDAMADEGLEIPAPSAMDDVVKNPDYKGWVFGSVDIDMSKISDKAYSCKKLCTLPSQFCAFSE